MCIAIICMCTYSFINNIKYSLKSSYMHASGKVT